MDASESSSVSAPPVPKAGEVLTLDDVRRADFSSVTPLAVLGFPIKHSVSPQMHNAALRVLAEKDKEFANWRYYRIEVPPERLKEALDLLAEKGFVGLNLTLPHKVLAMEWVRVGTGSVAHDIGAINTLTREDGHWRGDNTDYKGFAWSILRILHVNMQLRADQDVVLLGAGGVARAIACFCLLGGCKSLWIGNRTAANLDQFIESLESVDDRMVMHGFDLTNAANSGLPQAPLVVNATSLGLKLDDSSPIDLSIFCKGTKVFDTTYGRHRSALLKQADTLSFPASDGVSMLVNQGEEALYLWLRETGNQMTQEAADAMSDAAYEALGIPRP
jgi:shikimate dehydrogenase